MQIRRGLGELIGRTYDYVIASSSLGGKIMKMEVVAGFDSRPHKAVSFVVQRNKEILEMARSRIKAKKKGMKEKEDQERQRRIEGTKKIVASMLKDADTVEVRSSETLD